MIKADRLSEHSLSEEGQGTVLAFSVFQRGFGEALGQNFALPERGNSVKLAEGAGCLGIGL